MFRSLFMLFTYHKADPRPIANKKNNRSISLPHRFFDTTNRIRPSRAQYWSECFKGLRMVDVQLSFTNSEWHYPTYNNEVMAVMSLEHLSPLPRRNHQYYRLYSPSQLEKFHVLHPIEQTPDSSANKFLPYDFHIFIEKEHLTRRWSIRFSATRSSSWDMES
jgi:hypothetical protein